MIGTAARIRRYLYAHGVYKSERLPRPVISIGNLSVGGTGKTPHVMAIAEWLTLEGYRVAILSRGYGRSTRGVVWVSDGVQVVAGWSECGDEPYLLAKSLRNVPVLVGESRAAAGLACLARQEVDLFLLDDGFQHLPLKRDLDILLVDATGGLGNRMTLPLGPLREPPSHARFADALVITKCKDLQQGENVLRTIPFREGKSVAYSGLGTRSIISRTGIRRGVDAPGLAVSAFSALAHNDQFTRTLSEAGYKVQSFTGFRDHHRFTDSDIRAIIDRAKGLPLLTTEKDLVRLPTEIPVEIEALSVAVEWIAGWDQLSGLIKTTIGKFGK